MSEDKQILCGKGWKVTPWLRYLGTYWVTDSYMNLQRPQWECVELGIQSLCTRMPSRLAMAPWNRIFHRTPEVATVASLAAKHQQIVAVLFRVRSIITTAHDQNIEVIDFNPVSMLDQTHFFLVIFFTASYLLSLRCFHVYSDTRRLQSTLSIWYHYKTNCCLQNVPKISTSTPQNQEVKQNPEGVKKKAKSLVIREKTLTFLPNMSNV